MPEDIIHKVVSFIGRGNEPLSDKDLLLKQTAKELGQNRYAKFYRLKTEEIDPAFAQYLFCLYKTIYPARDFLKDESKVKKLKQISFEHSLSPEVQEIVRRLSPEAIEERAGKTDPHDLVRRLQDDFAALSGAFDNERAAAANKRHNLITAFSGLALFNYASFLQQFDPALPEGIFTVPPKFAPVKGAALVQDLGNFYTAMSALGPSPASAEGGGIDAGDDWALVFAMMQAANGGAEVLPLSQWNTLLVNIKELKSSKILELMVRLSSKNPVWNGKDSIPDEHVCENWFEEKKEEIRKRISGIANMQRNARMQALTRAIFGAFEIERLKYYNGKSSIIYTQRSLEGFVYAAGLNYLMAFIQDYVKKDIQEICDLVLIRGQWSSNNTSLQMSEAFYRILDMPPAIEALDASLSEEGSYGPRLKGALLRLDRDKSQIQNIGNIISSVDSEALCLIKNAVHNIIIVGKNMKVMADDVLKKESEVIINWKELDGFLNSPIALQISETYKKINYFVQLMSLVTHPEMEGRDF
ncbi:hypothetical protein AGMMS49587_00050 [Spirochaetia bacterium]|nr:hypothetical protein AGMMS49587_00050 [Spirochaetia bacterium]